MAQLILEIPETVYERLQQWAEYSATSVQDLFLQLAEQHLPEIFPALPNVTELSDQELLQLAQSSMPKQTEQRLLALRDQENLTSTEYAELKQLQRSYWIGQYTKTEAMIEANKRGLITVNLSE